MSQVFFVARFTRAWIETRIFGKKLLKQNVARFTRAWIETQSQTFCDCIQKVARFTRAWIETLRLSGRTGGGAGRPLHAGVD